MKTITYTLIALLCIILTSCTRNIILHKKMIVYQQSYGGSAMSECNLILWTSDRTYNLNLDNGSNIGGKYEMKDDTLRLTPMYEAFVAKISETYYDDDSKYSLLSIPLIFIMRGRQLIDVTKYENYSELQNIIEIKDGSIYNDFSRLKIKEYR